MFQSILLPTSRLLQRRRNQLHVRKRGERGPTVTLLTDARCTTWVDQIAEVLRQPRRSRGRLIE